VTSDVGWELTFTWPPLLVPSPVSGRSEAHLRVVNSAQTSESSEIYKSGSPHKVSEEPQSALYEGEGEI
jgi:hypothetical protein